MKQRIRDILIGVIISAFIFSGAIAIARPAIEWRAVHVGFGEYSVVINGVPFEATDRDGNVLEPFIKDGWIYAPFEHIARAIGMNAAWDGDTHTLYLNEPAEGRQPPRIRTTLREAAPIFERGGGSFSSTSRTAQTWAGPNTLMFWLLSEGLGVLLQPLGHTITWAVGLVSSADI